jgi:hypothetical protein
MFENVKIIKDSHDLLGKEILIKDSFVFLEPTDIQTAEDFEENLERCKIPYVLAQVETTLPDPYRYKRGYAIFVQVTYLDKVLNRELEISRAKAQQKVDEAA